MSSVFKVISEHPWLKQLLPNVLQLNGHYLIIDKTRIQHSTSETNTLPTESSQLCLRNCPISDQTYNMVLLLQDFVCCQRFSVRSGAGLHPPTLVAWRLHWGQSCSPATPCCRGLWTGRRSRSLSPCSRSTTW